ncbi:MAG: DUF4838 domain-containing protein [Clostridia bacterium]|nr:DUF4838 domain-containing protein [Clostridia bacterium]
MKKLAIFLICLIISLTSCSSGSVFTPSEKVTLTGTEGKADFIIVHREDAHQDIEDALSAFCKTLREKEELDRIEIHNDSRRENPDVVEILVGDTNRSASQTAIKDLRDREFTVGVYEGKFVIAGGDEEATVDAINHLYMHYDEFIVDGEISSENNYTLKYDYKYDNIKVGNTDISAYTVVYPDPGGVYAEKESAEKYAAHRLAEQISQLSGIIVPCENIKNTEAEYQIVIEKGKGEYAYSIKTEGKKITITADGIYAFTKAYDVMLENKNIPADFSAKGSDLLKGNKKDNFVYVSYTEDTVFGDNPVKSIKIGDVDITEYRIIHHDYGKGYSGYGMNEIYAAQQLQKYLKYALGVELSLDTDSSEPTEYEILIGNTDRTKEDTSSYGIEEYIIKTEDKNLIITGGEQRGTIYGVYSFLEDYIGCRFFTEDCEIIYKTDEIIVPGDINVRFAPVLEYRDTNEKAYQNAEIASKRKVNSSYTRAMSYFQGSSIDFAGGAFVHTMDTVYDLAPQSSQPCFSSEETYQTVLEKARKILKASPNAELISVTQNDNNNSCTCQECTLVYKEEDSRAAPLIRFVNRLAEELEDEYPNVKIQTLAYMFSSQAPTKTKPHKNVVIELCSLDACCGHPLCDLSCPTNAEFRGQIADWSVLTDNLYVWYYVVEFTGNAKSAPFMNFDSLYDTYTLFHQNGVKGVFNEANMNEESLEFGALRSYLISKLMWDRDMTREEFDTAIHEFIVAYYGEASDIVEEYFYMMSAFAHDRHFEQYAGVAGILDMNRLKDVMSELTEWMDALTGFDYTRTETEAHVNRLRKGYSQLRSFAANLK